MHLNDFLICFVGNFSRFCWPQSADYQHTVKFFFLKYYKCNFGIFVGKIVEFQKCGRNLSRDDEKTIYIPFMQQQVSIKAINATEKIT